MKLVIVAAINRKRVIGREGKIPWHIPEDLKRFKKLTMGHAVLMGRKTFASIGAALPGRRNIVITSHTLPGIEQYRTIEEALAALHSEEKVFIIGGGEIFRQTIAAAEELFLTIVDTDDEGDTFFPEYEHLFTLHSSEIHQGYSFRTYRRIH